jgi:hypothetical protein
LREQLQHTDDCLQLAYSSLSSKHRQQAIAALSAMQPSWWQPEAIWASLPQSQFVSASAKWLH